MQIHWNSAETHHIFPHAESGTLQKSTTSSHTLLKVKHPPHFPTCPPPRIRPPWALWDEVTGASLRMSTISTDFGGFRRIPAPLECMFRRLFGRRPPWPCTVSLGWRHQIPLSVEGVQRKLDGMQKPTLLHYIYIYTYYAYMIHTLFWNQTIWTEYGLFPYHLIVCESTKDKMRRITALGKQGNVEALLCGWLAFPKWGTYSEPG